MTYFKVISLVSTILLFNACDDDPIISVFLFNAHINNTTTVDYQVYLTNNTSNGVYMLVDTVSAQSVIVIGELPSNLNYAVRLVESDSTIDNYAYQKSFFSDGLDITITFP